jgi:hypothetical protein
MRRRWRRHAPRGRSGTWAAGLGLMFGAAALLTVMGTLPSARRYLRIRAM